MRKIFVSFAFILTFSFQLIAQINIDISGQLTTESYKERAEYIIKYAPSDSAYNVLISMGNAHTIAGTNSKARFIFKQFRKYFEKNIGYLNNIDYYMNIYSQRMLFDTYTPDQEFAFIEMIRDEAPTEESFLALQRVAGRYVNEKKWDSAIHIYLFYKPLFPYFQDRIDKIIEILNAPEEGLLIENLGPPLSSNRNEWDPNPTPDGKYFFFTSYGRKGGKGSEDVFMSKIDSLGEWTEPTVISDNINSERKETIDNISVDGNNLMLSGTFEGTKGKFDIYVSNRVRDGWTKPKQMPSPINTEFHDEGGYLTSDGQAFLFTSDRPASLWKYRAMGELGHGSRDGNMDIYVSLKNDKGWSEPINLGNVINTPYAERAPFLHPDGKTLYFSSDGHPGLGRLDLFKTTRLRDDSWIEWSEPVNLGKEINTGSDDWGYVISVDGEKAYFAGLDRNEGLGGWDLYSISIPKLGKPGEVVIVEGYIIDNNGNPVEADIYWEDLETGETIGSIKSNPDDGSYFIVLHYGKKYGYFAKKKGFYPSSKNIDISFNSGGDSYFEDIVLVSKRDIIENSVKVRMNNIFFDFDKANLKNESFHELDRLIEFLSESENINLLIEGHTDNRGEAAYNQKLSQDRANVVAKYINENAEFLVERKITITSVGFGAKRPIDSNTSSEGRAKNRRVEFSIRKVDD